MHVINRGLFFDILKKVLPKVERNILAVFAEEMMKELLKDCFNSPHIIQCDKILISSKFPEVGEDIIFIGISTSDGNGHRTQYMGTVLKHVINNLEHGSFEFIDSYLIRDIKIVNE
jgi:hypothetical protein